MKDCINKILNLQNQIKEYESLIFEKENDILACEKSIQDGCDLSHRQKNAVNCLFDLNLKKNNLNNELKEILKSLSHISFSNKKIDSSLVFKCISAGISNKDLSLLKDLYK